MASLSSFIYESIWPADMGIDYFVDLSHYADSLTDSDNNFLIMCNIIY